jgi:capsular exopolysaccharide synthesis family protein
LTAASGGQKPLSELSPYFIERLHEQNGAWNRGPAMLPGEGQASLREYWRVIRRHLSLIIAITLSALLIAGIAVFVVTPTYTASALILIEPQPPQVLDMKQLMVEPPGGEEHDYYKTQYALLRSHSLAAEVIHDTGLQDNPLLDPARKPQGLVGTWFSNFKFWLRGPIAEGEQTDPSENFGVSSKLVKAYLTLLSVQPEFGTRLVRISFGTPSPSFSATLANAHAEAYVHQGLDLRVKATQTAQHFLESRLVELGERVEKSEAALNSYRHDKGIVAFTTRDKNKILLRRLEDLNSALTQAETSRIELEAQAGLINQGDYYSLPRVVQSPMVQALKPELATLEAEYASMSSRYTLSYRPLEALKAKLDDTRARLNDAVNEIAKSVKYEYQAALAREKEISEEVEREKASALALNDASLKDAILAREVDTNRQLYESVLKRMKEMGVEAEVRASNVSVVDTAVPPTAPSSPRKRLVMLLTAVLGLSGAIGVAFCLDYFDETFKSSEEVEQYLRLPTLAFVPDMAVVRNGAGRPQLESSGRGPDSPDLPASSRNGAPEKFGRDEMRQRRALLFAREAYRTIRSQILLSRAGEPPRTVLITSAIPNEGKSITAVNTAITFARKGRRVLLIDADLRNGRCHELLKRDGSQGLSEVLTGQMTFDDAITATDIENLFLLRAGAVPPDPPELFGSAKMSELLDNLSAHYEHIIIDSAPVIPVSDSIVLSKHVDGVIVVAGRTTSKKLVRRSCVRLTDAGSKLLGVVLNQISASHDSYYPYNGYYYDSDRKSRRLGTRVSDDHSFIVLG